LTEKIPYLQKLGVTAIELMPVFEFNENESQLLNPITGQKLKNYWGYDPVAFFAPKQSYSIGGLHGQQIQEFQEMVKAFHRAGIEVILDIVLNHTAENDELGPTTCLRGIENSIFYMLQGNERRYYKNFSGVGNTLNANHPVVREFVGMCFVTGSCACMWTVFASTLLRSWAEMSMETFCATLRFSKELQRIPSCVT
jgi:isoamylase